MCRWPWRLPAPMCMTKSCLLPRWAAFLSAVPSLPGANHSTSVATRGLMRIPSDALPSDPTTDHTSARGVKSNCKNGEKANASAVGWSH